ncbi:Gfo/Idh/MocA family oxidoreductase [Palleronia sp. LCG004]|uniref:Gfo/Idh/MocA family protein n=1 Tax=Palleronia sp. LCG004 TaxID=3079304 RepID=UPI0029436112|nr:Gfo/Idh/MocA family oxidoreductase [Palleronia sp. LCG004]WOI56981.1 Gfo/Idh/MocA family oxidoreductase [Palleronia sp. LCG004]
MSKDDIVIGVVGIDHRHIYGMLEGMLSEGATCKGWWTEGEPQTIEGFVKRFGEIPRVEDRESLLKDPDIDMILIASPPHERADRSVEAMENGKDVMLDKPGCVKLSELERIEETVARTKRIWSIDFSERFEVPAAYKALEIVRTGVLGRIVQTVSVGPHRLNAPTRPDWFFDKSLYGGILGDIGTHQIDQFLAFTGSTEAEIVSSTIGNFANEDHPDFEDFGEVLLRSEHAQGYFRVDWYTPDALPNWGDGRLFVLGTNGYIELRKYVDVEGRPGTDHLFMVTNDESKYIDCADVERTYFSDLKRDVIDRTEHAASFEHTATVMRLALQAQAEAHVRWGHGIRGRSEPLRVRARVR